LSQAPLDVPGILRRYGLRPDKSLGQNFLVDQASLGRVATAAEIEPSDQVLEVGPGLGSLTRLLAVQASRVVAVELDPGLIPPLRETVAAYRNVEIITGDILHLDLANIFPQTGYLVVANIPYYLTSALIRRLLGSSQPPKRLVLTIQQEVAERICAVPGGMSLLSLSVQVYGKPQVKAHIPAGAFYPPPQVDSAVVRVDVYPEPRLPREQIDRFFRLARAGFSQKRKTLRNALSGGMGWSKQQTGDLLMSAGIDPRRRAETLSLEEWILLVAKLDLDTGSDRRIPAG
jgi:16S rRNA (adenine1518-N6/adenine1519-N6)-dimethyltransferase